VSVYALASCIALYSVDRERLAGVINSLNIIFQPQDMLDRPRSLRLWLLAWSLEFSSGAFQHAAIATQTNELRYGWTQIVGLNRQRLTFETAIYKNPVIPRISDDLVLNELQSYLPTLPSHHIHQLGSVQVSGPFGV